MTEPVKGRVADRAKIYLRVISYLPVFRRGGKKRVGGAGASAEHAEEGSNDEDDEEKKKDKKLVFLSRSVLQKVRERPMVTGTQIANEILEMYKKFCDVS